VKGNALNFSPSSQCVIIGTIQTNGNFLPSPRNGLTLTQRKWGGGGYLGVDTFDGPSYRMYMKDYWPTVPTVTAPMFAQTMNQKHFQAIW